MAKWIKFEGAGKSESGLTQRWKVTALQGGAHLGLILWFAPWRKYVFQPASLTVYEWDCLRDVALFLQTATKQHKEKPREA